MDLNKILYIIESIFQSLNIDETSIVKNKDSGTVYPVKNFNPDTQQLIKKNATDQDISTITKSKSEEPTTKQSIKKIEASVFQDTKSLPTEKQFSDKFSRLKLHHEFKFSNEFKTNTKLPQKYFTLLERLSNTKFVEGKTTSISDFINQKSGAGIIKSQAGEVLTMVAISMSDNEWHTISQELIKQTSLNGNKGIIDSSWVNAANNNRTAIKILLKANHNTPDIEAVAWDNPDEVNSIGFNYNDKENSTDIFIKVNNKFEQISLKKDDKANLLNTSLNKLNEWDDDFKNSDLDIAKYNNRQQNKLSTFINESSNIFTDKLNQKNIQNALRVGDPSIIIASPETYEQIKKDNKTAFVIRNVNDLTTYTGKDNKLAMIKLIDKVQENLKPMSDEREKLGDFSETLKTDSIEYITNVVDEITTNKKLKDGFYKSMVESLSIKNIFEGKESLVIGNSVFTKANFKDIFKTDNIDELKEKLTIIKPKNKAPYLAYKINTADELIPISTIRINEKPPQSGNFPFIMEIYPEFAKRIKEATINLNERNK